VAEEKEDEAGGTADRKSNNPHLTGGLKEAASINV